MTKRRKPNTSTWTLLRYYDEVFVPAKMAAGGLTHSTRAYYRRCVLILNRFVGRDVKCREVDDAMLDRLAAWMVDQKYGHHSARNTRTDLRSILRHRQGDAWPKMHGGPTAPTFADKEIDGTLDHIFIHHYLPERTAIGSESTVTNYGRSIRKFGMFLERPATPADLTDRNVGKFLRWMVEVEGVKPVTANGYAKQVKALWVWLAKKKIVPTFPTVGKLPEAIVIPDCWTLPELAKLVAACHHATGTIGDHDAQAVWLAFHLILWDSGERTGAMLALEWSWLDWSTGYLAVPGEFRKGRVKSVVYPLKPETLVALKAIAEPRRELVFDMLLPAHRFYRRYPPFIKSAGLPYVKRRSGPQKMRRTFASFIEAAGGNATRALKHTDRRTTETSYLDPRISEAHHENERLFPLEAAGGAA